VNLGLGYDLETGLFYSNLPLPQYLAPIVNGPGSTVPSGLAPTHSNKLDFAPQIGFAWSPGKSGKTVIRGGGGLYWDTQPIWQHFREGASIGPPGDGRSTLSASAFTNTIPGILQVGCAPPAPVVCPVPVGSPLPLGALTTMTFGQFIQIVNQQLPALSAELAPTPPSGGPFPVAGINLAKQGIEIYPSSFPLVRSYQTNIGVQHEFGRDMLLSADWVRTQGENINLGELDLNHFGRTADGLSPVIPVCTSAAQVTNPAAECSTGSITFWTPEGRSVYDALLVKFQKRPSHHYSFIVSYSLQKLVQVNPAAGLTNPVADLDNYFASYGNSGALPRQNLTIAPTVDLPWGFKLNLISSMSSPLPMEPYISGVDLNGSGNTSDFPLSLAVPNLPYNCFNAGCGKGDLVTAVNYWNAHVATSATGKLAMNGVPIPTLTLPTNYSLGAPIITQDLRVTKEFVFKERYRLQVLGEFFNLFNISNLSYSNFTLNTTAFGQATDRVSNVFGSGGPRAIQVGARFSF
jgi:hypothetical protein